MVKVVGSSGKLITIELLGIREVVDRILKAGQEIKLGRDLGLVRAGALMEEEVKESIAGNRAEPESVDTGLFANSIEFQKISDGVGAVKSNTKVYPGTDITTTDIAILMEYGTSKISPRSHFRNSTTRNQEKVKEIVKEEIKQKVG